jgi:hypothetical protein
MLLSSLLQPSLVFVGKARSLRLSGGRERCFTWVGSCLTCKDYTSWKGLPGANTLAYYKISQFAAAKRFRVLSTGGGFQVVTFCNFV